MINSSEIALITCIDCNKKIIAENNKFAYRFFEQEAIRCYTYWRNNAGWLKNINIYCLNSKNAKLQNKTLLKLKQLNITYIEDYNQYIANNKIEFIDKLYAQQFFEKSSYIYEKYLIYFDLDIFLIKELPIYLFKYLHENKIILAKHDKVTQLFDKDFLHRYNNITNIFNGNCYNAYFVAENKNNKFFTTLYDLIHSPKYKKFYDDVILLHEKNQKNDYYLFEESLYDYQWYLKLFNTQILNLNISEIENIYFKHQHMTFKEILYYI